MYRINVGMVSFVYSALYGGKILGEMGLLEHAPRSATVVVLEENTVLTKITEEEFFRKNGNCI